MNYANQFNEMIDTYTRAQQHIWNDWFDMMQGLQKRSIGTDVWQQPIEAWTECTKRMIETQTQGLVDVQTAWIRQGLDESNPWNQLPAFFVDWTRQSQQIAESSAAVGKQMVEYWIEAGGRFGDVEAFQPLNGTWQEAMNAWRESVNKLLQIQVDAFGQTEKLATDVEKVSNKASKETAKPVAERAA